MKPSQTLIFRRYQLGIQPADRKRFVAEGQHNMTTSIANEPGTLTMYATHADQLGTKNVVVELYQDAAHYQVHANSPQFKRYGQLAQQVVIDKAVEDLELVAFNSPQAGFQVSGPNSNQLLMFDVQLSAQQSTFRTELERKIAHASGAELAGYAATLQGQPTHWVILLTYSNATALQGGLPTWTTWLASYPTQVQQRILMVDTMVAQAAWEASMN